MMNDNLINEWLSPFILVISAISIQNNKSSTIFFINKLKKLSQAVFPFSCLSELFRYF